MMFLKFLMLVISTMKMATFQVGIIYLTAIIYSPTSEELQAGLEEEAVMCTSLHAEKVAPSRDMEICLWRFLYLW